VVVERQVVRQSLQYLMAQFLLMQLKQQYHQDNEDR
jgi:hypothetical protein